jgi:hypothetical protein
MTKKIVYLIGAGATEGAARFHGYEKSLLMDGLLDDISVLLSRKRGKDMGWARNQLANGANLERLVSLYEYSGTSKHIRIAKALRDAFRISLENRIAEIENDFTPELFVALLDMHRVRRINEELTAIFTTNYEDLLERSIFKIYGKVSYPIQITSVRQTLRSSTTVPFFILKLHGSFNWKSAYPIFRTMPHDRSNDSLWIPPGVVKRKEAYPFNILWGRAKELLDCDVLRIVGSSLSQNDWDLVALISIAQGLSTSSKRPLRIEFINSLEAKNEIAGTHRYLDIVGMDEIPEIKDYVKKTYYPLDEPIDDDKLQEAVKDVLSKGNIFELWLRAKGEKMFNDGLPLDTDSSDFKDFIITGMKGGAN